MTGGLTPDEQKVADSLVDAWNTFIELPSQHTDDQDEFRHALHRLQHLLGMRVVRRAHPDYWTNEDK